MDDPIWRAVPASREWLDAANGTDRQELTCRILKVTEEAGEAAGAWIGVLGQNPRKGVTHRTDEVAAELADVALTALVAISSLGLDARDVLNQCAGRVLARLDRYPAGGAPGATAGVPYAATDEPYAAAPVPPSP